MDAKEFLKPGGFLKKQDLRKDGPRRLTIEAVEKCAGYGSRSGDPDAEMELQLVFTDNTRQSLRTVENLRRMVRFFGNDTDKWAGQVVEAYVDPDVPNPKNPGDPGGIRLQLPGKQPLSVDTFVSDLEEQEA